MSTDNAVEHRKQDATINITVYSKDVVIFCDKINDFVTVEFHFKHAGLLVKLVVFF